MSAPHNWTALYQRFPDNETRAAQLLADFACWCSAEHAVCKRARHLVLQAAANAGLHLSDDFFCLAFTPLLPEPFGGPDQLMREPANEAVRQHAQLFRMVLERFFGPEFRVDPENATICALGEAFALAGDTEALARILESGDGSYSNICGWKVVRPDEFYSIAELIALSDVETVDEFLQEVGHAAGDKALILGNDFSSWRARHLSWRPPESDDLDAE